MQLAVTFLLQPASGNNRRGAMIRQLTRSFVFTCCLALGGLGVRASLFSSATHAQTLEQLSEILQPPSSQQTAPDELPAPQKVSSDDIVADTSTGPSDDSQAARRIYLGLEAEELPSIKGLRIATVTRDSPAWKSGFQIDDRIIGINGFSITKMSDMIEQMGKTSPGQSVKFLINRDNRTLELTSVLISQAMAQQIFNQPAEETIDSAWIGLTVHDLTPAFREQFGIGTYRGAAVSQVAPGSPAHRSGIRAGDAVTEVDTRPIESAADFVKWLESVHPGDQVTMIVYRGIARIPTTVVLSSEPRVQPSPPAFQPIPPRPRPRRSNSTTPSPDTGEGKLPIVPPPNGNQNETLTRPEPTQRELELQQEVQRLKQELADAQTKLNETRQQLNSILRALRD